MFLYGFGSKSSKISNINVFQCFLIQNDQRSKNNNVCVCFLIQNHQTPQKITMVLKVSERVHPPICPRVLLGSLLSLAQKPSTSLLFLWCLVILNQKTYTNIVILISFDHSESIASSRMSLKDRIDMKLSEKKVGAKTHRN